MTFDTVDYPLLGTALQSPDGLLLKNTQAAKGWRALNEGAPLGSWIGVPLIASNQLIGLLSLAHTSLDYFSKEHLRLARSLAIPAAAAIQNARLYERAEIYGAELSRRISDLHRTERALEESEEGRIASDDRFQKVFRSAPIALSVTTLADGTFVEVNEAFECRFGYTRKELVGRSSLDLGFWEDARERTRLIEKLRVQPRIRNAVVRFRHKSGEIRASRYSAETIELDGQLCILLVAEDLPEPQAKRLN